MRKVNETIIGKIVKLRQEGYSVPEISKEVPVSKTTVLRYVKGVDILPEFLKFYAGKRGGSRKRKLLKEELALEEGKKLLTNLVEREKVLYLCALYWAEGSKKDFEIVNSNPDIIRIFVTVLRDVFKLKSSNFRVNIRIYQDLNRYECLSFWSKIVQISQEQFGRIDVLEGKKSGKLKYGMCRVRVVKGGDLLKQVMGINKAMAHIISKEEIPSSLVPIAQMDRASRS